MRPPVERKRADQVVEVPLDHLVRLTDDTSVFEHAAGAIPRREHGYCTDDAGRALVVLAASDDPRRVELAERYLGFLRAMHLGEGRFALRLGFDRRITHRTPSDDACGRAVQGLGETVASDLADHVRHAALALYEEASTFRSPWIRANAHLGLGAAAVLGVDPGHRPARRQAAKAAELLEHRCRGRSWPEDRLGYGNGLIPEALLALGAALGDDRCVTKGAEMLDWLIGEETSWADHFSFVGADGAAPGESRPVFDQQPLEAATLVAAAERAALVLDDDRWSAVADQARRWFLGHNDLGVVMFDPSTGGGFDGLTPGGPNRNQGAESTIAMLSALHRPPRPLGPTLREVGPVGSDGSRR